MPTQQRILHPAFRDEYEFTTYPFGDWATLRNDEGAFISENTFLDASFYPIGGSSRLRLSEVVMGGQTVRLYVGDEANPRLCSGQLDSLAPADDIPFVDQYDRPAGIVVSTAENLLLFQTWSVGTHTFTYEETGFASTVCLPLANDYFRGFLLDDGSIITNDAWLVGDDGIVLSHEEAEAKDPDNLGQTLLEQRIRVDIVGDPLFRQRLCSGTSLQPNFVKTITFQRGCEEIVCGPDSFGEVKLMAGRPDAEPTILRVRKVDKTLRLATVGEILDRTV